MSPTSDPRLIKAQLDSMQSVVDDFLRDANEAIAKIEDPEVRRAFVSLSAAVDLLRTLTIVALSEYKQKLE